MEKTNPVRIFHNRDRISPNRSHFEDIKEHKLCLDPEHLPPTHIVIPYGKLLIHYCPSCNHRSTIAGSQVTY